MLRGIRPRDRVGAERLREESWVVDIEDIRDVEGRAEDAVEEPDRPPVGGEAPVVGVQVAEGVRVEGREAAVPEEEDVFRGGYGGWVEEGVGYFRGGAEVEFVGWDSVEAGRDGVGVGVGHFWGLIGW